MSKTVEQLQGYWYALTGGFTDTVEQISQTKVPLASLVGLFVVVLCINFVAFMRTTSRKGKAKMDPNADKTKEYSLVADKFHDFLFDLWHTGKLTEGRYRYWLRRGRDDLGLAELRPRRKILNPAAIKAAANKLKKSLKRKRQEANGHDTQSPLQVLEQKIEAIPAPEKAKERKTKAGFRVVL